MNILAVIWKYKSVRVIAGVLTLGVTWALSLFVAKNKGKSEGKQEVKLEQAEDTLESIVEFNELEGKVHAEVNQMDEAETDNKLRVSGWMRKPEDK